MNRPRQLLLAMSGTVLVGTAIGEHVLRQAMERRYRDAVQARARVERRLSDVLQRHNRLQAAFLQEQQRSKELSGALAATRSNMEEAVGRLSEETHTVRGLEMRLAGMQQQMDQLQGELALALQDERRAATASSDTVQLERVVVTDANAVGLQGRIVSVHHDWNFVVIDLGWDTVHVGDTVSILRNEQTLAKARVERVQEGLCAATVLPEWESADIRVNDLVQLL